MTGIEILGAVASAVQLAVTCYDVQKRIRKVPSDRQLIKTVETECTALIAQICENLVSHRCKEHNAVHELHRRLVDLKANIMSRNRKTLLASVSGLCLHGNTFKEELIMALQDYQTRAAMYGNGVVEKVLRLVSSDKITTEVRTSLLPIVAALEMLHNHTSKTSEELTSVAHKIDSALAILNESHEGTRKSNAEVQISVNELRRDFGEFRSSLPAIRAFETGPIERSSLVIDCTMREFLEKMKREGVWLSDQEIWECVWGVAETFKLFGVNTLLPYHLPKSKEMNEHPERFPVSSRNQFMFIGGEREFPCKQCGGHSSLGIWDCLGPPHCFLRN
jgi:hypothetical protein